MLRSGRLTLALLAGLTACGPQAPAVPPASTFKLAEQDVTSEAPKPEAPGPESGKATKQEKRADGRKANEKKKADEKIATPGELVVFTTIDPATRESGLMVWDEAARDAYALPVTGTDVGTGGMYMGDKVIFDRPSGGIFLLDLITETIFEVPGVNEIGFTARASVAKDGLSMTFVGNSDGLPGIRAGVTKAYYWHNGVSAELAKVNAVGATQGGAVARVRLAGNGKVTTFVTLDGGLFLYTLASGILYEVAQARNLGDGFSHHSILRGDGLELAWVSGRTTPQTIFFMDLATVSTPVGEAYVSAGLAHPLPEAGELLGSPVVTAPRFGPKNTIYFESLLPGPNIFKAFRFDRDTGMVRMLSLLNATVPGDSAIYTGTGVP